jgi:CheY-like chemotaxis protein
LTEEYQEHLFEPFFGTTQPGKNTGLGLATVYAIVKQHGGQISCVSEVGKGSIFKIYFPASKLIVREPAQPGRQLRPNGKPPVILLAEDEEVLREFANLILRKHGFHVLTARDGVEALKIAEQYNGELDLLFTDVVMPRMGGTDLYKRFTEKHPNTPVVFTSGYPRTILTESGLDERREYEFLQKPYTTQTLVEKIRDVISAQRPGKSGI